MSGAKRKQVSLERGGTVDAKKKLKTSASSNLTVRQKPQRPPPDLEAETDSDPILESDTTEHSGDDDGVSWPSDEAEEAEIEREKSRKNSGPKSGSSKTVKDTTARAKQGANGTGEEGIHGSSRESHAKQKALAKERRAAKPNADVIARAKKIWERLRRQSRVPREERKKLVSELFRDILPGRVKELVLKHDACRVIQTGLKYGNPEQRKIIASELKGSYCQLAEGRFSKHAVGKILALADESTRDMIIPEFFGHVKKLIRHPEAAWLLDDIYRGAATQRQKATLLREWYGPEFVIFSNSSGKEDVADLARIISAQPAKRGPIMKHLYGMINQLVQKGTTAFTMLHDAMLQYYLNLTPGSEEAREMMEMLKADEQSDVLKNLAFTKSGARLVSLLLAHGTANDRRHLLKGYKGMISTLAFDAHGHLVLLAALEVIDDTIFTAKTIFSELLSPTQDTDKSKSVSSDVVSSDDFQLQILDTALHLYARTPLLYPFAARLESLYPPPALALLAEVRAVRTNTSKKDPFVRRAELARTAAPPLMKVVANYPKELVASSFGCIFITELLLGAPPPLLPSIEDGASKSKRKLTNGGSRELTREEVLRAVADLVLNEEAKDSLLEPAAGRMLKALVQGGRYDPERQAVVKIEPSLEFAEMIFANFENSPRGVEREVLEWATGPNSFVILGMLEAEDFASLERLRGILAKNADVLRATINDLALAKNEVAERRKRARKNKTGPSNVEENEKRLGNPRGIELILQNMAGKGT